MEERKKNDLLYKRALFFVGDKFYHLFPFKDNLVLVDSCEGEFIYLGDLLGKGSNIGSAKDGSWIIGVLCVKRR